MRTFNYPHPSLTSGLLLASALALVGCVVAPVHDHRYESEEVVYGPTTSIYVRVAPPAPRIEYRGYPPAVGYIWIEGYWNWGGVNYLWVPGRWVAPRPGYAWIPHRWDRDGDRWRHDGGRWEPERRIPPPRQNWEHEREHPREYERPREVQPQLEQRPQVWPVPLPSRPRQDDNERGDERRQRGWRSNSPSPEVQRRAEPEPEQRSRGFFPRNEPREEAQRQNEKAPQRDQHRSDRRKDDDWRKDKDKEKDRDRDN